MLCVMTGAMCVLGTMDLEKCCGAVSDRSSLARKELIESSRGEICSDSRKKPQRRSGGVQGRSREEVGCKVKASEEGAMSRLKKAVQRKPGSRCAVDGGLRALRQKCCSRRSVGRSATRVTSRIAQSTGA